MAKLNIHFVNGDSSRHVCYDDPNVTFTVEEINSIITNVKDSFGVNKICHCHEDGCHASSNELPALPREYQYPNTIAETKQARDDNDHYGIRPRIPNNVVDINKLTIKNAVTSSALIRCPHCGQAHAVIISDNKDLYLMRKHYSTNEFGIIRSAPGDDKSSILHLSCNGDTPDKKLSYFYLLQSMPLTEDHDFAVQNDTELFCPVCHQSSEFIRWKEAFQDPLKYFEHEHLCDICGGECIETIAPDNKDKSSGLSVCDNCGKKWLGNEPSWDWDKEINHDGE